jgi:hypothetical protein
VNLDAVRLVLTIPYIPRLIILLVELEIVFSSAGDVIHPTEPVTLSLTITMLTIVNSSLTGAANTLNPTTADLDNAVAERSERPTVKANVETIQPGTTTLVSPLDETDHLPVASSTLVRPVAHSQIEVSHTALRRAEEVIDTIDTIQKWKFVIHIIKRVSPSNCSSMSNRPSSEVRWVTFRSSAEPLCKSSMESTLKDPRGASACLLGVLTFFLKLLPDSDTAGST